MISRISSAWSAMPLRRRLVLGLLGVVAITLGLVGAATYLSLRSWKIGQVDAGLEQAKEHLYTDGHDRGSVSEAVQQWIEQEYPAIERRAKAEGGEIHWGDETAPGQLSAKLAKRGVYERNGLALLELDAEDLPRLDEVLPRKLLKYGLAVY